MDFLRGASLILLPQVLGPVCRDVRAGGMASIANREGEKRLKGYFERIGRVLGRRERREAFTIYAAELLSDCERKSVEPLAAQACPEPEMCRSITERLLNFVGESPWDALRSSTLCRSLRAHWRASMLWTRKVKTLGQTPPL